MATEKRLIDANAYVDELKWLQEQVSSASAIEIQEYIDRTNRQPTVDAVEVVHGHWFWAEDAYIYCSECKQKAPVIPQYQDEPMTSMTNYCPNCGAKMDGERKDNE